MCGPNHRQVLYLEGEMQSKQGKSFLLQGVPSCQMPKSRMIHGVMAPKTSLLCHRRSYKVVAFPLFDVH
jgi:hypothetical protein